MLRLDGLSKTYANGTLALDGVSLALGENEIVAVVGGSGCGKSTLLRLASGLDRASRGRVLLNGQTVDDPVPSIGMVFQEPRLLPWLTVAENVAFGIQDLPEAQRRARVDALLGEVGLHGYAARWPKELSGGQAQRVAIARALAPEPDVLLLDEPFSALDAFTRIDLQDHLIRLWQHHRRTFLLVTHDIEEAVALADRVVVMRPNPGRLAAEIPVNLRRPRDRSAPEFTAAERAVRDALSDALRRGPQPSPPLPN
jgi:sulfonate transport system ATP-binding protein